MRVLAVDGTRLILPKHDSVIEEFGQHKFGPKSDSLRSMAMASMLYDVLNQITIDAEIAPYCWSEQELLLDHLSKVEPGDLLLLDRGYPSFWLLFLLTAKNIEFCVRLKETGWLKVKEFMKSDETERIISIRLPKKDRKSLSEYPEMYEKEVFVRLIKVPLEDGKIEILCTSLLDMEKYRIEEFQGLYHLRWNEEEAYKLLKSRLDLEDFSGKTATAVRQDFFAKVFLMTLCAAYAHPIEERVRNEYKADEKRKYDQKINRTNALDMTRNILIALFIKRKFCEALDAFDKIVERTREVIRPGRNNPRKIKPKRPFSMNYKRL